MRPINTSKPLSHLCFITDSEGDLRPFFSAIRHSKVIYYDADKGLSFHPMNETPYFIFGGDATDRGTSDLNMAALLIDFKKRYPEQVFLLAGNRDISKNRFKVELEPALIRERLLKTESPRWLLKPPLLPIDFVQAKMLNDNISLSIEDYVHALSIEECQVIYLHWMLQKSMGCPNSFRYRREELARLHSDKTITDIHVMQSFWEQVQPHGVTAQYLQLAQPIVLLPQMGLLAMHGGLQSSNRGRLPDMNADDEPIEDIKLWVEHLNQWYQQQIQAWLTFKPTTLTPPACTSLDELVLPIPTKPRSIIIADMLDANRQFVPLPEDVLAFLKANDIQLVLTGHQPCGDLPAILRGSEVLFINGDTGYAAKGISSDIDNTRGGAFHTLDILASHDSACIDLRAILTNKQQISTRLLIKQGCIEGDPYIGRVIADHQLVQCRLPNGDYRLAKQYGFEVSYSVISPSALKQQLT